MLQVLEPLKAENPGQPPPISVQQIDFARMGLPEYKDCFALVIDNLFSAEECQSFLNAAIASAPHENNQVEWGVAQINAGGGQQVTASDYRNSGRIILDSPNLARVIFDRLRPYLDEIEVMEDSYFHSITSADGEEEEDRDATLVRLNEQLKFLRYEPGQFFKEHLDASYVTPDKKDASYYTLQLYLNGDEDSLKGGATRIWTQQVAPLGSQYTKRTRDYIDVFPRTGRALVFEQGTIIHSGEEVEQGVKFTIRSDLMYRADEY